MPDRFDDPNGVNDDGFAPDDSSFDEDFSSPGRLLRSTWSLFLLLGVIAFELTASPAVGASTFCLKFAVRDTMVALWLLKRDPDLFRGVACGLIYFSLGIFKASVAAVVLGVVLQCATHPGALPAQWIQLLTVCGGIGFVLLTATTFSAMIISAVARRPLWLSHGMFREMRAGHWPPRPESRNNAVASLATLSVTAPCFFASLGLALFILVALPPGLTTFGLAALVVISLMGGAFLYQEHLVLKFAAKRPADCWPDEPEDSLAYHDVGPQSFLDPNHAD